MKTPMSETIAAQVRARLVHGHLTTEDLASGIGVSRHTARALLRGEAWDLKRLELVAAWLQISVRDLIP